MPPSAPIIKPRTRAGSWWSFKRRYKPIDTPGGGFMRDTVPDDTDYRYVWTVVDCDGRLMLCPGYHFVNRMGYVLCEIPFSDLEESQPGYVY